MMSFFLAAQWFFLLYFLALNAVYADADLARARWRRTLHAEPRRRPGSRTCWRLRTARHHRDSRAQRGGHILRTLHSLQQHYPEYEIVVGERRLDRPALWKCSPRLLLSLSEAYAHAQTGPVRAIYQSNGRSTPAGH